MDLRSDGQDNYARLESNDVIVSRLAQQDQVPWYSKPNLRLLYLLMLPACLGVEMTTGFDMSMINGLQAVPSWLEYYHHPHSTSLGLMVSMYYLGCFTAVPFVPPVVDRMGRRYSILLGGLIAIVGGVLQGSALNFTMFVVARFILGFASVFSVVAASSLIGELSHPKERAVMSCLFLECFYLGAVAAAGVTLGTFSMASNWGWRIPSFLQVFPSLLQIAFISFLPESPRWLLSKRRGKEAHAILVKYHAEGDENSEFVKAEYAQIEEALEAELKISRTNQTHLFSTPGMRKRVVITIFLGLCSQWCGTGIVSHFLSPILDNIGIHDNRAKNIVNLAKYIWSLFTGIACAVVAPQYPRRTMYLVCSLLLFIIFTAWTIANAEYSSTHSKLSAQVVLVLIFLYNPAYDLAIGSLSYTFLVELFPFHVRAKGICLFQWWNRGMGFLNQLVNPIGIDAAGWRWYIVYCVWNAFQVVFIYLMFPETSGRTLEELTFLYEDDLEPLRNSGVEALREHEDAGTYGTIIGGSLRTASA